MLSSIKINKMFLQIISLLLLMNFIYCQINYGKGLNDSCSVNLQCLTGCCQDDKCVETKKCKAFRNIIYVAVAIVGVVLAIIFTIYLMYSLCKIKKDFDEKAKAKRDTENSGKKKKS